MKMMTLNKYKHQYECECEYAESLRSHIAYVIEAGNNIGVPSYQLAVHDASKWGGEEFYAYAKHFKGGGAPKLFAQAWLHHIHNNPHHWQYWIFPDGYSTDGSNVENGVVYMPINYAAEMIADWMGASMAYTGSWDMTNWLCNNMRKIIVHSKTAEFLREQLDHLGYADVVYMHNFNEGGKDGNR